MRLIHRHIGRSVILSTTLVLGALLVLLSFFTFVEEMDDVGTGDYRVVDAFVFALLSIPRFLFELFPIAALLGSLIGLGVLASHSELTAMRASGVSVRRIIYAVLRAGVLMMIGVIVAGEVIAPPAEQYARRMRAERQQEQITLQTQSGFWARDGNAVVNIREVKPGARLSDIVIYEFNDARQLTLTTHAAYAQFEQGLWRLNDIHQSYVSVDGIESRRLESATWDSMLRPELLSLIVVRPSMLPAWGLYQYIRFMRENNQSAISYEVAFWTKVVTPVATLVMLFLAVPFVFGNLRSVSIGQRIFVGALAGSIFYLLNRAFSYMAVVYDLSPLLAAALPAIAFLVVAVLLLRRLA